MQIVIGTVSKEINSTYRPTLTTSVSVVLKDNVSITSPILKIKEVAYNPEYNYVYIPKWKRYYFINNAVAMVGGYWELELAIDVLASWKTEILASTAYVRRSASNYDLFIPDGSWSHNSNVVTDRTEIDLGLSDVGCYLITVLTADQSRDINSNPALSIYALSPYALKQASNYLFAQDGIIDQVKQGMDATTGAICNSFFNPFQYVVKCMWIPFTISQIGGDQELIKFGWWENDKNIRGILLNTYYIEKSVTYNYSSATSWVDKDNSWYSTTFYVPGMGQFDFDNSFAGSTLTLKFIFDLTTGEVELLITDSTGCLIQSKTGKWGADVQLSGLYEDYLTDLGSVNGLVRTGIGAGLGAMGAKGELKKAVSNWAQWSAVGYGAMSHSEVNLADVNASEITDSVVNGIQASLQPTASTIGNASTRAIISRQPKMWVSKRWYQPTDSITNYVNRLGGMCCKVLSLSSLSGYTEVVNPHINAPATTSELSMINQYLAGGFYIE